jgi:selenocysteine-specific elongation factor
MRAITDHLLESGQIVMAPGGIIFTGKAIEWIRKKLINLLKREGEATVSRFREEIDTSRKYAIPLLNLFEEDGIIIRDGDVRRLKDPSVEG